jgi:cellobiose phosphorylase
LIDPCIPRHWRKATIRRPFRGAIYEITIKNPHGVNAGVKQIMVDGVVQDSNLIEPHQDGQVHPVEVLLGKTGQSKGFGPPLKTKRGLAPSIC